MTINSMTGFARTDGSAAGLTWHWEVRSVNARGLDIRVRLPAGSDALDLKVRELAARKFTRGNVSISLNLVRTAGETTVRLNETVLAEVIAAAETIRSRTGGEAPSVASLLSLKGVLEIIEAEPAEADLEARHAAMLADLAGALDALAAARGGEGARLEAVLANQIDEIARLVAEVENAPARSLDAIRTRLATQVARLIETAQPLDPQRLHQEAVILATRADVDEELKRLSSHIAAARQLIAEGGAIGRKLDFLAQEFNREANTLCSKANDDAITRAGLAMKVVIDQMREQVQNIE